LVEVLVVIAIVGLLIALLLVNNLKQLGLAVQGYSDVHGALPAAAATGPEWSNKFSMGFR
jgi:hypothetical protein